MKKSTIIAVFIASLSISGAAMGATIDFAKIDANAN